MEILMVRKSGPVQPLRLGSWIIALFVMLLLVMMLALVGGGYLFLQQSKVLAEFGEGINLLMLRVERLEFLMQEQETRELIAQEEAQAKENAKTAPSEEPPTMASLETGEKAPKPEPTPAVAQEDSPRSSDAVSINRIDQSYEGNELLVYYDVTNQMGDGNRAEGYVSLILHSIKDGKPRLAASPPMRLNAQGRPVSYRRGMPFAVHRFRRIAARFNVEGRTPERLEFVVYSRRGQVLLVYDQSVLAKPAPTPAPTKSATPEPQPTEAAATAEPTQHQTAPDAPAATPAATPAESQ